MPRTVGEFDLEIEFDFQNGLDVDLTNVGALSDLVVCNDPGSTMDAEVYGSVGNSSSRERFPVHAGACRAFYGVSNMQANVSRNPSTKWTGKAYMRAHR